MALRVLNDQDAAILQRLIDRERQTVQNTSGRAAVVEQPGQAPDVYVVLTPPGGIARRVGLTLGHSTCNVFQEVNGVLASCGFQQQVFNLYETDISGGKYVAAKRDKFGTWYADQEFESEDPELVCVTIYDVCERRNRYFYLPDEYETDLACLPCLPTGTSTIPPIFTGTSTTTGPCGGCTGVDCYRVTGFTGLTNVGCPSCSSITLASTTMILEKAICTWVGTFFPGCAISQSNFVSFGYHGSGLWALSIAMNGEVARYETINPTWNCNSTLSLARVRPVGSGADSNGYCANYPSVVFVEPCSVAGTSTGHPLPVGTSTGPNPAPSCGATLPPTVTRSNSTKCRYDTCFPTITSPYYTGTGCLVVNHSNIGTCAARMTIRDGDGVIVFDDMVAGSGPGTFTPVHKIGGVLVTTPTMSVFSLAQFGSNTYATGAMTAVLTIYDSVGGVAVSAEKQVATILNCTGATGTSTGSGGGSGCPAKSLSCAGAAVIPFNTNCTYTAEIGTDNWFRFPMVPGFTYTLVYTYVSGGISTVYEWTGTSCGTAGIVNLFAGGASNSYAWAATATPTNGYIQVNNGAPGTYTIRVNKV